MVASGGNDGGLCCNSADLDRLAEQAALLQELIDPASLSEEDELVVCARTIHDLIARLRGRGIDKT